jgi:hypothetical protein
MPRYYLKLSFVCLQTFLSVPLRRLSQFEATRLLPLRTYWPHNQERCSVSTEGVLKIYICYLKKMLGHRSGSP